MTLLQHTISLLMLCKVIRVGIALQVAANHRLRLLPLSYLHSSHVLLATHISEVPEEIGKVGSIHQ